MILNFILLIGVLCLICYLLLWVLIFVVPYIFQPKKMDDVDYILVLGARVTKTGVAGESLKARLDLTVEYAKDNEFPIIVSGGQQSFEGNEESIVMDEYLIEAGIDSNRIILEHQAKNTYENFLYSKEIIDDLGGGYNLVVISQNFHMLRALIFAHRFGFKFRCHGTYKYSTFKIYYHEIYGIIQMYWYKALGKEGY